MALKIYLRGRNADGSRSDELTEITALCGGITLEGAVKSASRKLSFDVLRGKQDYYLSRLATIRRGDGIVLDDGSEEYVFFGIVWRVEANSNSMIQNVTCYDNMKFLMTSETITNTWADVTPQEVTRAVCKELGVTCGELPETDKDLTVSVNAREKSGYEAIMIAWTEAHKLNQKVYYPRMVGYKLHVIEKGEKLKEHALRSYSQDLPGSLISVSTTEDSEGAITALYERGEEGAPASFVEQDEELVKLYGWIVGMNGSSGEEQTSDSDVKKINDGKKTANVQAVGDWQMQTGWSVAIESDLLSEELLYIESDRHSYENGIHTMELELSYENSMDEVANGSSNTSSEDVEGDTIPAQVWNFLRANGFTAAAAAGVMGNIAVESGWIVDVEEYGGGGGYGLCQWTGSRRTDLMNWCSANGVQYNSVEGQLKFMLYEVETYGYTAIKTMTNVEEACRYWLTEFERAGIPHLDRRLTNAQEFYNRWKNYKKVPTSGKGTATGSYTWPCPGVACALTTYAGHTNNARDLPISMNTKIVAMDGGTVEQIQHWDGYSRGGMQSYGNTLVVRHATGKYTRYAHLNSFAASISNGQKVSKGQVIGYSGTTGNSSGPHLHLEIVENGVGIDPASIFGTYYSG